MKHKISKSSFIRASQCLKSIYLHYNHPELKLPVSYEQQALMDSGTEVGKVARQLFPTGIDLTEGGMVCNPELIEVTRAAIDRGEKVLFEAAFSTPDLSLRFQADILVIEKDLTRLIEVKSSTAIKQPEHIIDIAFQWYVLKQSGYKGDVRAFVAHLNNQYVRGKELDVNELFTIQDVTDEVILAQDYITQMLPLIRKVLEQKVAPDIDISENCFKPYPCDFYNSCWKKIPSLSVFDIGGIRKKKAFEFYRQGIIKQTDIPRQTKLSDRQWIEVDATTLDCAIIDHRSIREFLKEIRGPLHFLDFETYMPAIPLYPGTRPYQQLTFQYCLLSTSDVVGQITRREFLAEPGCDPRQAFIEQLLKDTAPAGSIIVYNKSFEVTRLKELAEAFPQYSADIEQRIARIVDLMEPFAKRQYYSPGFEGSHSIKAILPVLVPSLSYANLSINNGAIAMSKYQALCNMTLLDAQKVKSDLLEYCYTDVLAMVEILNVLKQTVK